MPVPIIDLFAGPGGLGEGFMSLNDRGGNPVFDIKLSFEKDGNAHKTLLWRSFYRRFLIDGERVPDGYYRAYRSLSVKEREKAIQDVFEKYPRQYSHASKEALLFELGKDAEHHADELIRSKIRKGEDWVLIGGPPCQAYSNVGRSRVGGIKGDDHRVYLYQEYLRILKVYSPTVFVMENVKGLLSARIGNQKVFDWIKRDLSCGGEYELHSFVTQATNDRDYLIKSEQFGIPQKRHRVILLGIRKGVISFHNTVLGRRSPVSLGSVIDLLPPIRSRINRRLAIDFSKTKGTFKNRYISLEDSLELWKREVLSHYKMIDNLPRLNGGHLEKLLSQSNLDTGGEFVSCSNTISRSHPLFRWFSRDDRRRLKGIANHESRSHLSEDLKRYLFSTIFSKSFNRSPKLMDYSDYSEDLLPNHENAKTGKFSDRFRAQLFSEPATTVTSHISKDGHYFIHYDPKQVRSLTVREAARIQSFPDNYLFRGSRTQQFHQVGNAVPPFLAYQLAQIVALLLGEKFEAQY